MLSPGTRMMTEATKNIVVLKGATPNLYSRVRRKREVLQLWLDNGIPHDKLDTLPRSLNEARKWQDADLGVYSIGSPNNFTTRHPDIGSDVEAIGALITKLHEKVKRPANKRPAKSQQPKITANEIEQTISSLISQWHMAREESRRHMVRADLAEKHRDIARDELRVAQVELAELRRRLSSGLKLVR